MIRTLLVATSFALAASAQAEEVAAVMLIQGTVTVHDADGSYPADVGTGLSRSDTVITGEESAVVLHLRNNHLVRLDEDLELSVADLVLLDAPSIPLDVDAQLASLLYPGERESMRGTDEASRVAGWQSRLTAGHSVGTSEESARSMTRGAPPAPSGPMEAQRERLEEEDVEEEADDLAGDDAGDWGAGADADAFYDFSDDLVEGELVKPDGEMIEARQEAAPPPVLDMPADDVVLETRSRKKPKKKDRGKDRRGVGKTKASDAPAQQPTATPASTPLEQLRQELFNGGTPLRQCLDGWGNGLPVRVDRVLLSLRLDDNGVVDRVVFDQGLSAPTCARDLLVGRRFDARESQLVFDIQFAE